MKKFTQLVAYSWIILLASCNSGQQALENIAPVSDLNYGSNEILHDIAVQNVAFLRKVARGQMRYKKDADVNTLLKKLKSGKIDLNDKASALLFYKEISSTPELYADHVNELYEKCKRLVKLNETFSKSNKVDIEKSLSAHLDAQYSVVLAEPSQETMNVGVWDSFMGPGSNDNFGYEFRHQCEGDQNNASLALMGGGNIDEKWAEFAQCSQSLNVALDICLRNFAIKMAFVAALAEAPPAAGGLIAEAIVENYFCKEDAFQSMDICAGQAGFYRN